MQRMATPRDRAMRAGKFEDEFEELQRMVLNHELLDDLEMLEGLAVQVFPLGRG